MRKFGIFSFVLLILVLCGFCSYLFEVNNGEPLTFTSFLNILSNAPEIDNSFFVVDLTIYGDWGSFEVFRLLFNSFSSIIELLLFLVSCLLEGVEFILYFIRSLFGFSSGFISGSGGGGGGSW